MINYNKIGIRLIPKALSGIKYSVKPGDTLSHIAKLFLKDANRYLEIALYNKLLDINNLQVGQVLNIPTSSPPKTTKNSANPVNFSSYTVKVGDNLSKIAKQYGVDFSVIVKDNNLANPNQLSVGLKLKIRDEKYIPQIRTIDEISLIESDLNNKSNLDIINYYHSKNKTGKFYIVDDKAKGTISIYQNGKLIKSYKAIHGKNKLLDDMTVTKMYSKGKLINLAGNLSTPAGIYFSTRGSDYHGAPSWIRRTLLMVDSKNPNGIPSSIHARIITESANTNGCTGVGCSDLQDMAKYLTDENIPTYILPVDKRNKFFIRNGELQFKSHDISKTPAHNTLVSRPIHQISYDDKGLSDLNKKVINSYIKGIIDNKKMILDKLGINNDTYNKLSKMALGILGVESNFGNKNSAIGNLARYINKGINSLFGSGNSSSPDIYSKYHTYGIDGDNNSVGLTQIRMKYVPKEVKALYDEFGITKDSLVDDPLKAAIATIIKLADEYKRRGNNIDKAVIGWNNKPSYLNMVNDKSSRFKIYEKYKQGGLIKSNKLIPKIKKT